MKKPLTSSSCGPSTKWLYTRALRPLDYNWRGCYFHDPVISTYCDRKSERSWWVSRGAGLVSPYSEPPPGAKSMCQECMREVGLLW